MKNTAYTLRELNASDLFPALNIIGKIGVSEFKACFESEEVKAAIKKSVEEGYTPDLSAIGISVFFEIANVVIKNLPSCEKEIYLFLSGLSGMKESEIAKLPLGTFTEMIVDTVKQDGFKDFIQAVSKLLK